jgi:S-adenosylmethionine synthetase
LYKKIKYFFQFFSKFSIYCLILVYKVKKAKGKSILSEIVSQNVQALEHYRSQSNKEIESCDIEVDLKGGEKNKVEETFVNDTGTMIEHQDFHLNETGTLVEYKDDYQVQRGAVANNIQVNLIPSLSNCV